MRIIKKTAFEGGPGGGGGGVGGGGIPTRIEDVPFRRQDRRVLNARKKRVTDRKLYKCILITGLLLILIGGALLYVFLAKQTGKCNRWTEMEVKFSMLFWAIIWRLKS